MWRRTALVAMLVGTMLSAGAQQAFAWCNGPYEGNGYGTHDWVLDHAIDWAGSDAHPYFQRQGGAGPEGHVLLEAQVRDREDVRLTSTAWAATTRSART